MNSFFVASSFLKSVCLTDKGMIYFLKNSWDWRLLVSSYAAFVVEISSLDKEKVPLFNDKPRPKDWILDVEGKIPKFCYSVMKIVFQLEINDLSSILQHSTWIQILDIYTQKMYLVYGYYTSHAYLFLLIPDYTKKQHYSCKVGWFVYWRGGAVTLLLVTHFLVASQT